MTTPTQALMVRREDVEKLEQSIVEFVPGSRELPPAGRRALAYISLANGLNPFLKEAHAIPVKDRNTKQVIGFELMVGITGWRRVAHESGEYWGRRFEPCSDEERKWLGVTPNDLAFKCIVMRRKTGQQPMEFDGYGIYRKGEFTKMNPLQCARLRAERDALKSAFPISLSGVGGGRIRIVDEDTGEIIGDANGGTAPAGSANVGAETGEDFGKFGAELGSDGYVVDGELIPTPEDDAAVGEHMDSHPLQEPPDTMDSYPQDKRALTEWITERGYSGEMVNAALSGVGTIQHVAKLMQGGDLDTAAACAMTAQKIERHRHNSTITLTRGKKMLGRDDSGLG